jgi:hypothetical protein
LKLDAIAAAKGSLINLITLNPAIIPAFKVAYLWESLKTPGILITTSFILVPRYYSAYYFKY